MKSPLLAALFILVLCVTGLGAAGIVEAESLEWKTMDSPLIVRGKIVALKDSAPGQRYPDGTITIAVAEVLRGKWAEPNIEVFTKAPPEDPVARERAKSGHEQVFFLRRANRSKDYREIEGKWVFRQQNDSAVIDLAEPAHAYTADLTTLKTGKEILDLIRLWAGRSSREIDFEDKDYGRAKAGAIVVPFDPPIRNEGFGKSSYYMTVPAEEKHRAGALAQIASNDVSQRSQGAQILGNLPEQAETTKALQGLLSDPGEVKATSSEYELAYFSYPARQAAWVALVFLGHKPEAKPIDRREPTAEEQQATRLACWNRWITIALGQDWKVVSDARASAPPGWTRQQGADGYVLQCEKGPAEKAATLTVYLMPKNSRSTPYAWVAFNKYYYLNDLMQRSFRKPGVTNPPADKSAAYLGVKDDAACHVFVPPQTPAELRQSLVKAWKVKIHRDY